VEFHIRTLGDEPGQNEKNPRDVARVEKAWGRKSPKKDDYTRARNGDHLMVPFECDGCIFRKLRKTDPVPRNPQDELLLACLRRINLDAFWSRAGDTVKGNRDKLADMLSLSKLAGLKGPCVHDGPYPDFDHCGYEVAINMLIMSRRAGRNSRTHLQFDTIRKLQSAYGNQVRSSPQSTRTVMALGDQKGRYLRFSTDPVASLWFHRFLEGCRYRMGQEWRPNQAMSLPLLLATVRSIEDKIETSPSARELNRWTVLHTFVVVTYVVSLRGPEGFLLDLDGCNRHWKEGASDHFIIALRGKIKGEHNARCHLLPCVPVTGSGLKVKDSLKRLLDLKATQDLTDGPAISKENGQLFSSRAIDDSMLEVLEELFVSSRDLFPSKIETPQDLRKSYQVFKSLRRTSDTQALEMKVSKDDIDVVNRWAGVEKAQGRRPGREMRHYYADITLLLKPFLRYTRAM
jgi:hypothetical protein